MKNNIIFLLTRLLAIAFLIAIFVVLGALLFAMTEGSPLHETMAFSAFVLCVITEGVLLITLFFLAQDVAIRNYKSSKPTRL